MSKRRIAGLLVVLAICSQIVVAGNDKDKDKKVKPPKLPKHSSKANASPGQPMTGGFTVGLHRCKKGTPQ